MTTIQNVLDQKGRNIWTIQLDAAVFDALQLMARKNVGSLVVMNGDAVVGILTERHYAREIALKGRASPKTAVREIMETEVIFARPEQTVEECMAVMTEMRVRHLPVSEHGKLAGIVSMGDLVKSKIADQEFTIDQLVHYVQGTRG